MKSAKVIFIFVLLFAATELLLVFQVDFAEAVDRYVAETGSDSTDCSSGQNPCQTIAYAVGQAASGDRIRIAAGYYAAKLTLNKSLTFSGAGMYSTILDGEDSGSVISFTNPYNVAIEDLSIENGSGDWGGGISQFGGSLTLTRVNLTGNTAQNGGGIFSGGSLNMIDCAVTSNSATSVGGGLFIGSGLEANLVNVTISGNTATTSSGGVHHQDNGLLNLTNVTISGNSAHHGGAINNTIGSTISILNSSIAYNHYTTGGYAGGINNYGTINIKNSILASNDGANCFNSGLVISLGHNLDSGSSCNFTQAGDIQNTDPQLGSLAYNGGLIKTHSLLDATILHPRSQAIDAGEDEDCPSTDARGMIRPKGTHCDIGAFEFSSCQNKPARIEGASNYYDFVQQTYNNCVSGQIIQLQEYEFSEALTFAQSKNVTVKGGYDCAYSDNSGSYSIIRGRLTIGAGSVAIGNVIIR